MAYTAYKTTFVYVRSWIKHNSGIIVIVIHSSVTTFLIPIVTAIINVYVDVIVGIFLKFTNGSHGESTL